MFHVISNGCFQLHLERHIDACVRELQLESGESQRFANHLKERFCKDPANLDVLGGFCHQLRAVRTASFSTDMDDDKMVVSSRRGMEIEDLRIMLAAMFKSWWGALVLRTFAEWSKLHSPTMADTQLAGRLAEQNALFFWMSCFDESDTEREPEVREIHLAQSATSSVKRNALASFVEGYKPAMSWF